MSNTQEIKWIDLDSADGQRSLKRHGFIATEARQRRYSNETYIGNISLCGMVWADNGNEEIAAFSELENDGFLREHCCKKCLKVYDKS